MVNIFVNYLPFSKHQKNTDISYPQQFIQLEDKNNIKINFNKNYWTSLIADFLSFLIRKIYRLGFIKRDQGIDQWLQIISRSNIIYAYQLKDIDVILSHWFFPIKLSRSKIPIVFLFDFPSNEYVNANSDEERKAMIGYVKLWFSKSELIIMPSQSSVDLYNRLHNSFVNKIIYLPKLLPKVVCVDENFIENKFNSYLPIKILFVGRDGKRKGLFNLLEALRCLKNHYPHLYPLLEITIVSETDFDSKDINITHYKQLDKNDVFQKMKDAHIFCLPTLKDSYGLVYLEAMACGCAIIADNCEPRNEILQSGECGLLIDPQNIDGITTAIYQLVSNNDLARKFALNAIKRFAAEYSFAVVSQKYINVISNIINQ